VKSTTHRLHKDMFQQRGKEIEVWQKLMISNCRTHSGMTKNANMPENKGHDHSKTL